MADKILCPNCNKLNDMHKFCIYCGEKLTGNTNQTCIKCGRIIEKNQTQCVCGHKVNITSQDYNSENEYVDEITKNTFEKFSFSEISHENLRLDKIQCPKCYKYNDIHKFCVHCGEKLLEDYQINVLKNNKGPYCLNCGRPVKKGQSECECGYLFININCPACNTKNSYTNRFCTKCGKQLWKSDVFNYKYSDYYFEEFPEELRYTSIYGRSTDYLKNNDLGSKQMLLKLNEYLVEIDSRWKIVAPDYCINCLNIINPSYYQCKKCGNNFADKTKVKLIKSKKYIKPDFDNAKFKKTSIYSENYLSSLAPALGESQFEYIERLKWEFNENSYHRQKIFAEFTRLEHEDEEKERRRQWDDYIKLQEEQRKQEEENRKQNSGGYCGWNCEHYYERWLDSRGGITGSYSDMSNTEHYCSLGHSLCEGSYCEDFK